MRPVNFHFEGANKDGFFTGPITVTMNAATPGVQIRYRLDGEEPTAESPLYEKPFQANESLSLRAALFDKDGRRIGNTGVAKTQEYRSFEQNLTTGKPVKASSVAGEGKGVEVAANANDGWVAFNKLWGAWKPPQWWQVDLEKS